MSATPLHGQVALSSTPQPLSSTSLTVKSWVLRSPSTNTNPAFMGSSTVSPTTGHQLDVGDNFEYELKFYQGDPFYPLQPSDIYVVGSPGDVVTWFASP